MNMETNAIPACPVTRGAGGGSCSRAGQSRIVLLLGLLGTAVQPGMHLRAMVQVGAGLLIIAAAISAVGYPAVLDATAMAPGPTGAARR